MKKIYTTIFSLLLTFSLVGCGDDNSFTGKNLLAAQSIDQATIDEAVKDIYDKVILRDIYAANTQALKLIQSVTNLKDTNSSGNLSSAQASFKKLVLSYKRVESVYIAGRESDDMRDLADFRIEQFIFNSKGDTLFTDLDKIFNGIGTLQKSSHKGITALEYTLFDRNITQSEMLSKMNTIRRTSALTMAETISQNLVLVEQYYERESIFLEDSDTAISLLLNTLVDNAFKSREKRVGDAAGFTKNFIGNPRVDRLEYHKSVYSLEAIKEILNTHKSVMQNGLSNIAKFGNADSEGEAVVSSINAALAICDSYISSIEAELTDVSGNTTQKTRDLYNSLGVLQTNYTSLISGLNFRQDLLEADGD